jgi:hypothetical protein
MADWVDSIVSELRRRGKDLVSLDTPDNQDGVSIANDIAAGFTPGVGTAMSLRDYERARRDGDYLGMGLSAVGMIPMAAGMTKGINSLRKTTKAADKTVDALRAYPRGKALTTAQKNAVEMLDLPPNNSSMDRARAMGFDMDYNALHGTAAAKDFKSFKAGKDGVDELGKGIYFTNRPEYANTWAQTLQDGRVMPSMVKKGDYFDLENSPDFVDLATRTQERMKAGVQMNKDPNLDSLMKTWANSDPEFFASHLKNQWRTGQNDVLERAGYVGSQTSGYQQVPGQRVIFNPANIRSRFAAFDPAKADSTDILAGTAATAITLPAILEALRNKEQLETQ